MDKGARKRLDLRSDFPQRWIHKHSSHADHHPFTNRTINISSVSLCFWHHLIWWLVLLQRAESPETAASRSVASCSDSHKSWWTFSRGGEYNRRILNILRITLHPISEMFDTHTLVWKEIFETSHWSERRISGFWIQTLQLLCTNDAWNHPTCHESYHNWMKL